LQHVVSYPRQYFATFRMVGGDLPCGRPQRSMRFPRNAFELATNPPPFFRPSRNCRRSSHVIVVTLFNMSKQWKIRQDKKYPRHTATHARNGSQGTAIFD